MPQNYDSWSLTCVASDLEAGYEGFLTSKAGNEKRCTKNRNIYRIKFIDYANLFAGLSRFLLLYSELVSFFAINTFFNNFVFSRPELQNFSRAQNFLLTSIIHQCSLISGMNLFKIFYYIKRLDSANLDHINEKKKQKKPKFSWGTFLIGKRE